MDLTVCTSARRRLKKERTVQTVVVPTLEERILKHSKPAYSEQDDEFVTKAANEEPNEGFFPPGSSAKVVSFKSRPDLNGLVAHVISYDDPTHCYAVQLLDFAADGVITSVVHESHLKFLTLAQVQERSFQVTGRRPQ